MDFFIGVNIKFLEENQFKVKRAVLDYLMDNDSILTPYGYEEHTTHLILVYAFDDNEVSIQYDLEIRVMELLDHLNILDICSVDKEYQYHLSPNLELLSMQKMHTKDFFIELNKYPLKCIQNELIIENNKAIELNGYDILLSKRCDFIELWLKEHPNENHWKRYLKAYFLCKTQLDKKPLDFIESFFKQKEKSVFEFEDFMKEVEDEFEIEEGSLTENNMLQWTNSFFGKYLYFGEEQKNLYKSLKKSNRTRDYLNQKKKEKRNEKVIELYKKGCKRDVIAKETGLSLPTIRKIIKNYKE